jgi:hypothetical protein
MQIDPSLRHILFDESDSGCALYRNYLVNDTTFSKMYLTLNVYFDLLYNWYLTIFLLREEFRDVLSQTYLDHHVKCIILLFDFNQTSVLWTDFNKSPQYKLSQKSLQ